MSFLDKIFNISNEEYIAGLTPELKGIYVSELFKKNNSPILLVTSTLYEANKLQQIISNYTDKSLLFPMDDFLTSEALAISPELKITRLETLDEIIRDDKKIVITNMMGYLRYLPKHQIYKESYINLEVNTEYKIDELIEKLYQLGYEREVLVNKTGEMAIRGFVLDIFPLGETSPIRIEFWGDQIDSIRIFNTENQLTLEEIKSISIRPNTEFLVSTNKEITDNKQKYLNQYGDVVNISAYLNDHITVFNNYDQFKKSYESLLEEITDYKNSVDKDLNIKYMNSLADIIESNIKYLENFDNITYNVKNTQNYKTFEIQPFQQNYTNINKELNKYIKNKKTVIICLSNRYQINKIIETLENKSIVVSNENDIIENKINLIIKNIDSGYIINDYVVISENEIFNKTSSKIKYKSNFKMGTKIKDINKLNEGDYIVHFVHGIGKYIGLKTLDKNGIRKDYLAIEYKGGDKLYIPVEKMDMISKYSSNESIVPRINKLGSSEWIKTKARVKKKIEDIAGKLLELYAKREASIGISFDKDTEEQAIFENNFMYTETTDQLRVMDEIKEDMEAKKPMDRLVCGDVGYGKTELAFRAIFKAVMSGKQAAFLCPTTILSNQHYQNAIERFSDFPINIKLLNRFVTSKKAKEVLKGLKNGTVDVVIGTHRLLSEDVKFKELGLLVVDEEQRFGVKHKEKIKEYKNNIDILTLSATPIPRTLQMSMTGIRNLSLLETPPVDRYPVQTYVLEENKSIIKDAIYKELSRDGQVFILFNYVENMEAKKREIESLIPEARVVCAHGQMSKTELEKVMMDFINKEYDVLLCTTIIETGIDIPNVNTLLIIDADRFGLSQLYQIRGRVGRSNKIAYCYLMYHPGKTLTDVANKRLKVIKEFTELGSGFSIAMRDLSIRGAGDILGSEQAGFIDTVGIELYLSMLNEEVDRLNGKTVIEKKDIEEQPLLDVETSIDENYTSDDDIKIEIHKKINSIDSYEKLIEIKEELEDRFGKLDEKILVYMHEEWFEKLANSLNITKIRQTNNFIEIVIPKELTEKLDGEKLFMDAISISRMFRFGYRGNQLLITLDIVKLDKHFIYYLIQLMNAIKKSIV